MRFICKNSKVTVLYQFIRKKSTLSKAVSAIKELKCGQPTADTHPHLIKHGEIMPNIKLNEFKDRRQKLMELIIKSNKISDSNIAVIPSASKKYMSDRIPYVFRQNTDFLYLSGCLEPDSCLVLCTKGTHISSTLFIKNSDPHSELWDGPSTSPESAPILFGVDNALPITDLPAFLVSFTKSNNNCIVWYDLLDKIQPFVEKCTQEVVEESKNISFESIKKLIHKLRLIKSPAEIELMKKSCEITANAFHMSMSISKPNITEHQIFATVDYECRMRGAEYLAYPPVIAGGNRATTIHYINNNQVIADNELVLMDAGCELHGYSSDVTRTWPINGTFNPEQKLLYEIIQDVQQNLIKALNTSITLDKLFDTMCVILGKRLQEVGLIPRNASKEQAFKTAFQFCPHHVSHYLGMDVHDTNTIPRNIPLEPGMIITVEPGIYINKSSANANKIPQEFHGIGIRIEDDVLITENGPVVLTESCVKHLISLESIIKSRR